MNNILISATIGLAAAVIDTAPMIIKKLDTMFILSAFFFWLILGFLIPRANIVSIGWLNGIIVSWFMLLPLLFLIIRVDKEALSIVMITTTVLGAGIGIVSQIFIK